MKILFFGDSITDAFRSGEDFGLQSYGCGYVRNIVAELQAENPIKYQIINRGVSGNSIADLYARAKMDVWDHNPDVLSVLVGINDVYTTGNPKAVRINRFEDIYRMLIEDSQKQNPNIKIILCEPFVLMANRERQIYQEMLDVENYAKVVKKLANEYNLPYVLLQDKFREKAAVYGDEQYLYDGVHPTIAGAKIIADEWLNVFKRICNE